MRHTSCTHFALKQGSSSEHSLRKRSRANKRSIVSSLFHEISRADYYFIYIYLLFAPERSEGVSILKALRVLLVVVVAVVVVVVVVVVVLPLPKPFSLREFIHVIHATFCVFCPSSFLLIVLAIGLSCTIRPQRSLSLSTCISLSV